MANGDECDFIDALRAQAAEFRRHMQLPDDAPVLVSVPAGSPRSAEFAAAVRGEPNLYLSAEEPCFGEHDWVRTQQPCGDGCCVHGPSRRRLVCVREGCGDRHPEEAEGFEELWEVAPWPADAGHEHYTYELPSGFRSPFFWPTEEAALARAEAAHPGVPVRLIPLAGDPR